MCRISAHNKMSELLNRNTDPLFEKMEKIFAERDAEYKKMEERNRVREEAVKEKENSLKKQEEQFSSREENVRQQEKEIEVGFGYTGKDIVLAGRYPYMKWWKGESIADEELALKCMEYTGTRELAERPVNEVSGGQKQRILLAKVLAQQTPILFLDEPTTGLDMVYQEEIFRFSKSLTEMGKTILMVVHELNLAAKYCSRIILLGDGTVIADGKPDDVFTETVLSKAYHAPVRVIRSHNTNEIIEISTKEDSSRYQRDRELLELICCKGYV